VTFSMSRELAAAAVVAALLHVALFVAVEPVSRASAASVAPPPSTWFMESPSGGAGAAAQTARTVWSPVLFSLPSSIMGFSRELQQKDVRTRLTFSQAVKTEQFLKTQPVAHASAETLVSTAQEVAGRVPAAPALPSAEAASDARKTSAPRVYVAPELKERLTGGIVLPPGLNQNTAASWEVRAAVSVSEQGAVRHVFLERPLELPALNQQVLQLLYGLRFKAGPALEGSIELYSPQAAAGTGAE